jgi:hypothetical protein
MVVRCPHARSRRSADRQPALTIATAALTARNFRLMLVIAEIV